MKKEYYPTSLQNILAELELVDLLVQIQIWRARQGTYMADSLCSIFEYKAAARERFSSQSPLLKHYLFYLFHDPSHQMLSKYLRAEVDTIDGKYKLKLKKDFWTAAETGRDSKGGAIVHKISHEEVYTDDLVYGEADVKQLAQNDSAKSVANADNREYYT